MRVSFVVYGVLYVVVEMVGRRLELVGWPRITPLDVATAVADALLLVAVGIAILVGFDVGVRRWRRSRRAWAQEQARLAGRYRAGQQPIDVPSWRPAPLALTAGVPAAPSRAGTYTGDPWHSPGHRYPDEPGHLL
jgi:hypothetical protein